MGWFHGYSGELIQVFQPQPHRCVECGKPFKYRNGARGKRRRRYGGLCKSCSLKQMLKERREKGGV